jgi:hypothetical protein
MDIHWSSDPDFIWTIITFLVLVALLTKSRKPPAGPEARQNRSEVPMMPKPRNGNWSACGVHADHPELMPI